MRAILSDAPGTYPAISSAAFRKRRATAFLSVAARVRWSVRLTTRCAIFAQAVGEYAKTDAVDARMLAWMGATLSLQSHPAADEHLLQLNVLLHAAGWSAIN